MTGAVVGGRTASEVLSLPVRMHGIQFGTLVDVLLDATEARVLGFEVLCRDGDRRFLPFAVARLRADEIAVESALTLIDERDVDYYRRNSRRLAEAGYDDPRIDDEGGVHEALSAA
jgi:hypothetical protein